MDRFSPHRCSPGPAAHAPKRENWRHPPCSYPAPASSFQGWHHNCSDLRLSMPHVRSLSITTRLRLRGVSSLGPESYLDPVRGRPRVADRLVAIADGAWPRRCSGRRPRRRHCRRERTILMHYFAVGRKSARGFPGAGQNNNDMPVGARLRLARNHHNAAICQFRGFGHASHLPPPIRRLCEISH